MPLRLWVICFLPVVGAGVGWATVVIKWRAGGRKIASSVALGLLTVSALVNAAGTVYLVYFACVPKSTSWTQLPEYSLDVWVMLLAFCSVLAGLLAFKRERSWGLCGIVWLMSGWQLFFSMMHAATL
jgi:hypothetical protein